jgi:hypothetical protein
VSTQAFENARNQVATCGIWCGSCAVGNGALAGLAGRYEQLLRAYGVAEWGPKEIDYDALLGGLAALREIPGCPGCRQGGGLADCVMRKCAAGKGIEGCNACGEQGACEHAEVRTRTLDGALAARMVVRTEPEEDLGEWIARQTAQLERTWPSGVVFLKSDGSEASG